MLVLYILVVLGIYTVHTNTLHNYHKHTACPLIPHGKSLVTTLRLPQVTSDSPDFRTYTSTLGPLQSLYPRHITKHLSTNNLLHHLITILITILVLINVLPCLFLQ